MEQVLSGDPALCVILQEGRLSYQFNKQDLLLGISLVVQKLRIHLAMQGYKSHPWSGN